jgi:peptidoglycan/xylan/chitin deacetylase (PgdA/CDA1 family)
LAVKCATPIVSFTFDDFPRSALHAGGECLKQFGAVGTYYVSLGLMGQQTATGTMFTQGDLEELASQGHELGCHTYWHSDAWETKPAAFENSVLQNRRALSELLPGATFNTLSYPISVPRPWTKRRVSALFAGCRAGGQILNTGTADLNHLAAFFLEKTKGDLGKIERLIEENRQARGWLIFATHDISKTHTEYGCRPEFFEAVVRLTVGSGAQILPVFRALEMIRGTGAEPSRKVATNSAQQ